ncbi:NBR1-Ig-like domain-containing protein [Duganella violaceipulchra]|nr:NBR1-Ig-like domain-containing protein [Duganella violaceicalia]
MMRNVSLTSNSSILTMLTLIQFYLLAPLMHAAAVARHLSRDLLRCWPLLAGLLFGACAPAQAQVNDAKFISHSLPATMYVGKGYPASVTLQNTGTSTWQMATHSLGSQNPTDNAVWGMGRVPLDLATVAPGQQYTFQFTAFAPDTPGSYNFQWKMVQDGLEWFGEQSPNLTVSVGLPPPVNDAAFVEQNTPATMVAGQTYNLYIKMRNTGTTTWSAGEQYLLGAPNPQDNTSWLPQRVMLTASVKPTGEGFFYFPVTAPSVPGTYDVQWRMLREFHEWFGAYSTNVPVVVTAPPTVNAAEFVGQTVTANMSPGQEYTVSVTMRNTGNTTWTTAGNYRLGAQNPQDNQTWGTDRMQLASAVAPGQQGVFSFQAKAPSAAGVYNFQWRMVQDFVEWFGSATPNLSVTVGTTLTVSRTPSPMVAGRPYTVTWSSPTATAVSYQCTASGTGYAGSSATLAPSGEANGTALQAWVGNPSTCTWTATGPGGTKTVTETMTTSSTQEAITYFHNDTSGTPVVATDASGSMVWKETYRPYGEKIDRWPGSGDNKIGYHGKPFDDNTGLSYMGARYYDPVLGRFTGIDPAAVDEANIHSFNRYAFANNNPYKFTDPDGRNPVAIIVVGARLMGVGLAANEMVTGDVPVVGGTAAKAGLSAAERLAANRVSGKVGEAGTRADLGNTAIGEQITVILSNNKRAVVDFFTRINGKLGVVETKVGGARLSKNQAQLEQDIANKVQVTPVGKKADDAGLIPGQPVTVETFKIDRRTTK